jgi:hypothetical protein
MTSNWGTFGLHGKVRRYHLQWNWSNVQIHLKLTVIIERIGRPESILVLRRWFCPLGRVSFLAH